MESKEELVENIREWIKMDSEILKLKKEIKERNDKKKLLTESLMTTMKNNKIDCFDINGGALVYKKSTIKKPINGKILLSCLQEYYKNNIEVAEQLTKFILDSREEQVKETIGRKIYK